MQRRPRRPAAVALVALAAALLARGAAADEFDIRKADNGVSLGLGASYLDYAETAGGSTLDTEKGWLPTADLGFGILAFPQAPIPNLYFHLGAQASVGSTYYDGALCNAFGFCTPYQSKTDDDIVAVAVQLGRAFPIGRTLMLTPFGEIGYRYWARDLTGTGGYTEDYHNWDGMGGLLLQYSPVERWVLSLSGAAGQTFGADLTTQGETFNLGSKLIWRTEAKLGFRVSERVELTGSAAYESFGYGASPPDVNGFYEPDSTTHQTTLLIGIAYHFF